jgi:hypothetical protein
MAAELLSTGFSPSWQQSKTNVLRVFEQFRKSTPELEKMFPKPWDQMSEDEVCTMQVYGCFASFLLHVYLIESGSNKGEPLRVSSVLNYVGSLIQQANTKFKANGSHATKMFFTCQDTDSSTDEAKWLRGLKKNIHRVCFSRMKEAGQDMDNSEDPVYHLDVWAMSAAYAKEGSPEACMRSFALITALQASGRSNEISFIHLDGLAFDFFFRNVDAQVPQSKVSKMKHIAFGAGKTRHNDWFGHYGAYLASQRRRPVHEEGMPDWLIPELHETKSPGM